MKVLIKLVKILIKFENLNLKSHRRKTRKFYYSNTNNILRGIRSYIIIIKIISVYLDSIDLFQKVLSFVPNFMQHINGMIIVET